MAVFDKNGNYIESPDLELGRLVEKVETLTWNYILESEEQGHYITLVEYPNGGKDVDWVVDVPEVGHWEAHDESGKLVDLEHYDSDVKPDRSWDHTWTYEYPWLYYMYESYTEEELAQIAAEKAENERLDKIDELKAKLAETDYVVIKIAEYTSNGTELPEDDAERYADIMAQREQWRKEVNELETQAPSVGE